MFQPHAGVITLASPDYTCSNLNATIIKAKVTAIIASQTAKVMYNSINIGATTCCNTDLCNTPNGEPIVLVIGIARDNDSTTINIVVHIRAFISRRPAFHVSLYLFYPPPPQCEQTIIFRPFHDAVLTVSLYKSAARAHASFWNLVGGMSLGSIFFAVMLA